MPKKKSAKTDTDKNTDRKEPRIDTDKGKSKKSAKDNAKAQKKNAKPQNKAAKSTSDLEKKDSEKKETKVKQPKIKEIDLQELLKAGAHFGHQVHRWNPKMAPYIFTKRNNVHIIDLTKTAEKLKEALEFLYNVSYNGGSVLFVGTKKQAQKIIEDSAKKCDSFYVSERWLGGMLTNFETISFRIKYLERLESQIGEDKFATKKEKMDAEAERDKLLLYFKGIRKMKKLPDVLFVVDILKERNAIKEAKRLGIPVVGLVDTNADPDEIKYPIPANDDAIKTIKVITELVAETICEAKGLGKS